MSHAVATTTAAGFRNDREAAGLWNYRDAAPSASRTGSGVTVVLLQHVATTTVAGSESVHPEGVTDAWDADFAGMIGYADSKGWVDDDGGIRAHIEVASFGVSD